MKTSSLKIRAIFTDIGGVLLTNGWDKNMRKQAAKIFQLNEEEMNSRHTMMADLYEIGKISLDDYLDAVVFFEERSFTKAQFKKFMFDQSQPYAEVIDFMKTFKAEHQLKMISVNNEGRELMDYRIQTFKLYEFIDFFVTSSFVHLKKPDKDIFKLALDLIQLQPEEIIYIDDRLILVEVAQQMGMYGVHYTNRADLQKILEELML